MNNTLKIFAAHHFGRAVIDSALFFPVRGGAVFDKSINRSYIQGDDTGDNISEKNYSYCELTVQYWAWKNAELDYYGFCHYRRYFSFNLPEKQMPDLEGNVRFDYFDENVLSQIICEPAEVISKMNGSPFALTTPIDYHNFGVKDIYEQFITSHNNDIDILMNVIKDLYPEYYDSAMEFVKGQTFFPCNMFIMKKALFFRYCQWLFPILQECEKRIDFSGYNIDEYRIIGFLAERCLGIFYTHIKKNENIEAAIFHRIFIKNPYACIKINPHFEDQITIATASNNFYVPYMAVMIQGLLENSSAEKYGIYILHTDITLENQKKIKTMSSDFPNVFICFCDISPDVADFPFKVSEITKHISKETFYRTLLHKIFSNFTKVLYLDADMVIQADVAELFRTNLNNNLIGACLDVDFVGMYYSNIEARGYADNILKLRQPVKYFQAGVLLFNIERFREKFTDFHLANLALTANYRWGDQDVLNVCCHENVLYLDPQWNVMVQHKYDRIGIIRKCPLHIYQQYMKSRDTPKIIHYAGEQKPWDDPEMDFAERFWAAARRTPFYEVLLHRMINPYTHASKGQKENHKHAAQSEAKKILSFFFPSGSRRRRILKRIFTRVMKKAVLCMM